MAEVFLLIALHWPRSAGSTTSGGSRYSDQF
jgi:hypothetical protein